MLCAVGRITSGSACKKQADGSKTGGLSVGPAAGRKSFSADQSGSLTPIFMFTLVTTVAFVGMATDYGRSFAVKAQLNRTLDTCALVGGKTYDKTGKMDAATNDAIACFQKFLPHGVSASITSTATDAAGNVTMTASSNVKTLFMPVIGINSINVASHAKSLAQNVQGKDIELALVMDVTGSMADNSKLDTAKLAAKDLVGILMPTGGTGTRSVKISIVPFSEYVNAGSYAAAATGVSGTQSSTYACTKQQQVSTQVCVAWSGSGGGGGGDDHGSHGGNGGGDRMASVGRDDNNDNHNNGNGGGDDNHGSGGSGGSGGSHSGTCTRYQTQTTTQTVAATCTRTTYVNTCMAERMATTGHAYDDAPPSTSYFHAFPETNANNTNCQAPAVALTPLTNSKTDLNAAIDVLTPAGGTAGHIGTAWGWYTISSNWSSFWPSSSAPQVSSPNVMKAVIVMTDGDYNTHYDSSYGQVFEGQGGGTTSGNGASKDQALSICSNMKAAGVEVFAVGVELSNQGAKDTLNNCVSTPNQLFDVHYFDVNTAVNSTNGLRAAFQNIATKIVAATRIGRHLTE